MLSDGYLSDSYKHNLTKQTHKELYLFFIEQSEPRLTVWAGKSKWRDEIGSEVPLPINKHIRLVTDKVCCSHAVIDAGAENGLVKAFLKTWMNPQQDKNQSWVVLGRLFSLEVIVLQRSHQEHNKQSWKMCKNIDKIQN